MLVRGVKVKCYNCISQFLLGLSSICNWMMALIRHRSVEFSDLRVRTSKVANASVTVVVLLSAFK